MTTRKPIKDVQIKVHVSEVEKEELKARADAAGLSLSRYLLTVGLARQTGVTAERNKDHIDLLEMVLSRLELISEQTTDDSADTLMVLEKLCQVERMIMMLAPVSAVGKPLEC